MRNRKPHIVILVLLMSLIFASCSSPTPSSADANITAQCDVEKFANISGNELVAMLGEPDSLENGTTNGYAEFPCKYYDYDNVEELGEVSFILINDSVVKLVSYHDYPFNGGKTILESFNLTADESCVSYKQDTYSRYRCVNNKVDDFWATNVDKSNDSFGCLQVTFDMFYFEEWYLPMDTTEKSNYQYWTEENVRSMLELPDSAKFPNILEWRFGKNPFYVAVQSQVESQSEFYLVYTTDTSELVYAIIDNTVVVNNGFVPLEEIISQLIGEESAEDSAESATTEAGDSEKPGVVTQDNSDDTTNVENSQKETYTTPPPTIQEDNQTDATDSVQTPSQESTQHEVNDINDLIYVVNGVCASYNSQGGTALNGRLYGPVNSSTSITIQHLIGDLIPPDKEYVVQQMESTILSLFSQTLGEAFPEPITISVYSTYGLMDFVEEEAPAPPTEEPPPPSEDPVEPEGDMDGFVTELPPELEEELENAENQS